MLATPTPALPAPATTMRCSESASGDLPMLTSPLMTPARVTAPVPWMSSLKQHTGSRPCAERAAVSRAVVRAALLSEPGHRGRGRPVRGWSRGRHGSTAGCRTPHRTQSPRTAPKGPAASAPSNGAQPAGPHRAVPTRPAPARSTRAARRRAAAEAARRERRGRHRLPY
jgi:hypothetical protein